MSKENVKVVLNKSGVSELLKSQEMLGVCKKHADSALSSLGPGYEVTSMIGEIRANAEVAAVTRKARKENMENNTILKAVKS